MNLDGSAFSGPHPPLNGPRVDIEFRNRKLLRYYTVPGAAEKKFGSAAADSFFDVVDVLKAVSGLHELSQSKGFSLENLRGKRKDQQSIRLNRQWRLIIKPGERPDQVIIWDVNKHDY